MKRADCVDLLRRRLLYLGGAEQFSQACAERGGDYLRMHISLGDVTYHIYISFNLSNGTVVVVCFISS